jgi:hypothetical protein
MYFVAGDPVAPPPSVAIHLKYPVAESIPLEKSMARRYLENVTDAAVVELIKIPDSPLVIVVPVASVSLQRKVVVPAGPVTDAAAVACAYVGENPLTTTCND